jgi:hypothetical protein
MGIVVNVFSIDPGEKHQGTAYFINGKCQWAIECTKEVLYNRIVNLKIDQIVVEEYRLYPWLASQQGFSTMPTIEVIGVIKWLSSQRGISVNMRPAMELKAAKAHFAGQTIAKNDHALDAELHGMMWLREHKQGS